MAESKLKIGILGLGKMGGAIAAGIAGVAGQPYDLFGFDLFESKETLPARRASSAEELEKTCDILILAVKPADMESICSGLKGDKQYISIAAGLSTEKIKSWMSRTEYRQIARAMPNLAATVHKSVTGIYCPDASLKKTALEIFRSVGISLDIPKEDSMHAVTALAGSGPAFVFEFVHALAEGGVLAGIPFDQSLQMASDTVIGSLEYLKKSKQHPSVLRNDVASPGGTTIAGLMELESNGFHASVMKAVKSATDRSRELGK
jgi:pyrroline-5-carboxylate reductase